MSTAPSVYEYRDPREWETALAEWCAENEPRTEYYCKTSTKQPGDPLLRSDVYAEWHKFYSEEERTAWLAAHPELTLLELTAQGTHITTPRQVSGWTPGCTADHLDGGSRADYRAAGFKRY